MHPESTPRARSTFERTEHPGVYRRGNGYVYSFRRNGKQVWGRCATLKEAINAKVLADAGAEAAGVTTPAEASARYKDLLALQARMWARAVQPPYVYFLVAPNAGAVKIGSTANLVQRCRTIQAHAPELLALVYVTHDAGGVEDMLHHRFRHLRRSGEWFAVTDELTKFLALRGGIAKLDRDAIYVPLDVPWTPEGA